MAMDGLELRPATLTYVNDEAIVLWLDMLGYRGWLYAQSDIVAAEERLLGALRLIDKMRVGEPSDFKEFGIHTTVISDTIIIWSYRWHLDTWIAMHAIYHVLATELGLIGLPLRGALSIGTLRIRDQEPRLVLGESLVYCASLEPTLKTFVVAIDDSAVKKIYEIEDKTERSKFLSTLSLMTVLTNAGPKRLFVMNWMLATVPHALVVMYRALVTRFRQGDREALRGLINFLPKFSNSREMIKTLRLDDEFRKQAECEWEEALRDSESIWTAVGDAAKTEAERLKAELAKGPLG